MANILFNAHKTAVPKADFDFESNNQGDAGHERLVTSGYTPAQDAHDLKNDITNLMTGVDYGPRSARKRSRANEPVRYTSASTNTTASRSGPCTPTVSTRSMSAVRLGPVTRVA